MKLDRYELEADESFTTFEFVSKGIKGKILKVVQYRRIGLSNIYNLAFGDKDAISGEMDDTIISNNGDSEKVLATVAASLYDFTDEHPDVLVYVTGKYRFEDTAL